MTKIFRKLPGFLVVFLTCLLGFIFIYSWQTNQDVSVSGQASYPGPNVVSSDPYPAPINLNSSSQDLCTNAGEWASYVNEEANFSFIYPAESRIEERLGTVATIGSVDIVLQPRCYVTDCSFPSRLNIKIYDNSQDLSLDAFIEEKILKGETSFESLASPENIVIDGVEALYFENGFDPLSAKPDVYLLYNEYVIRFYIDVASPVPPHDLPCSQTLKMFDEILASVQLGVL